MKLVNRELVKWIFNKARKRNGTVKRKAGVLENLEDRTVFAADAGWGFAIGSTVTDFGFGTASDAQGNVFVAGRFQGTTDFDPGAGSSLQTANQGDGYVAKYSPNRSLLWTTKFGGSASDRAWQVTADSAGNVHVTGNFQSPTATFGNLPPLVNTTASGTGRQEFIAKLNGSGQFLWAKNLFTGGEGDEFPRDVALDNAGNIYVPGRFHGNVDFNPGSVGGTRQSQGNADSFILKLDGAGSFQWVQTMGGTLEDTNWSTAVDASGSVYTAGTFRGSATFPTRSDGSPVTLVSDSLTGDANAYVLKLDSLGNTTWIRQAHSPSRVALKNVALDGEGDLVVTGWWTGEAQFPDGTIVTTTSTSVFLSKWDNNGQLTWVKPLQSTSPTEVSDLDLDTAGNAYIAGVFEGTTDFDPGAGTAIRVASSDGRGDGYLLKLDSEGNYQAVKQVGGAERQWVYSVNVAVDGAVYGSGYFKTEAGLPTGEWLTSAGDSDAFLFKLAPDAPTKFFVVDGSADRTDEYDAGGNRTDAYSLATASGNLSPRGAASNLTGDRLWVIDANRKVYVYDGNGTPLGSWTAGGLTSPQGITVHGSDLWIVDDSTDRVYKYAGATTRTAGTQNATTNFKLNVKNDKSKDLVTDGTSIWTVNDDLTDKVFKYTLAGALLGSWTIDGRNVSPTGITLDPTNPTDLWIVDNAADQVFAYVNATSRTTGSQSAAVAINLALGSSDPQGIADPPADAVDRLFAQLDKSSSDSTDEQDATARQAHFVDVALSAGAHPTYKRTRRSN